jgi:putative phosphoesterase
LKIGILSDTHMPAELRVLWDEVRSAFEGVDLILHAGDIVHPSVLDQLEAWAPVLAARGNNDHGFEDPRVRDMHWLEFHGFRVAMVHDMEPEDEPIDVLCKRHLKGERPDVIVTGHTHFERLDYRDGVLQLNPGSPVHPHLFSTRQGSVGILEIAPGSLVARIVKLGDTEGRRNPCSAHSFDGAAVTKLD